MIFIKYYCKIYKLYQHLEKRTEDIGVQVLLTLSTTSPRKRVLRKKLRQDEGKIKKLEVLLKKTEDNAKEINIDLLDTQSSRYIFSTSNSKFFKSTGTSF